MVPLRLALEFVRAGKTECPFDESLEPPQHRRSDEGSADEYDAGSGARREAVHLERIARVMRGPVEPVEDGELGRTFPDAAVVGEYIYDIERRKGRILAPSA